MHRFYLPPECCSGPVLCLTDREAHHALHVLRISKGDPVVVLDGLGRTISCIVQEAGKKKVSLRVTGMKGADRSPCEITLLQALPKGKIFEDIIQKATELGVTRIVPLLSERVVTRLSAVEGTQKAAKWKLVAIEAIKQCGAPWLPTIEAPVCPGDFIARREQFELPLVASLHEGSRHAREYFESFKRRAGHPPRSVCIWVGPEGDFTRAEIEAICGGGALPISLGPLVLRCETAATYCLSIINYETS